MANAPPALKDVCIGLDRCRVDGWGAGCQRRVQLNYVTCMFGDGWGRPNHHVFMLQPFERCAAKLTGARQRNRAKGGDELVYCFDGNRRVCVCARICFQFHASSPAWPG